MRFGIKNGHVHFILLSAFTIFESLHGGWLSKFGSTSSFAQEPRTLATRYFDLMNNVIRHINWSQRPFQECGEF